MHVPPTDSAPPPVLPRVARGDKSAVSECIQRYGRLVQSLVQHWFGRNPDTDDAVQEIFIELWKNASRFDPTVASEVCFVSLIARRKLIDRYRRWKAKPPEEVLTELVPIREGDSFSALEVEDELTPVRALLAELPDQQRRILLMAVCEGWTHQEIAEQTGLPLGTIKTQIRRGLLLVRERLTGGPR